MERSVSLQLAFGVALASASSCLSAFCCSTARSTWPDQRRDCSSTAPPRVRSWSMLRPVETLPCPLVRSRAQVASASLVTSLSKRSWYRRSLTVSAAPSAVPDTKDRPSLSQKGQRRQRTPVVAVVGGCPFMPSCRVQEKACSSRAFGVGPSFNDRLLSRRSELLRNPPSSVAVDTTSDDMRKPPALWSLPAPKPATASPSKARVGLRKARSMAPPGALGP